MYLTGSMFRIYKFRMKVPRLQLEG